MDSNLNNNNSHPFFSHKKAEVLGMDVDQIRVEKAVHESLDLMKGKDRHTIFFLSAASALYCQSHEDAADFVSSCSLVLPGDSQVEQAMEHVQDLSQTGSGQELPEGLGKYADSYVNKLFHRLNRDAGAVYAVFEKQEELDAFLNYTREEYPSVHADGILFEESTEGAAEKVVNEINAIIPDLVFVCLHARTQIHFVKDYFSMMNVRLCVCMEGMRPLVKEKTEEVPSFFRALGLSRFYRWLRRERKLQTRILQTAFRKKMTEKEAEHSADSQSEDKEDL